MNGVPSSAPDVSSTNSDPSGRSGGSVSGWLRGVAGSVRRRVMAVFAIDDAVAEPSTDDGETFELHIDRFPDRKRPLTYPGRDVSDVNTTDVIGIETEDGLRLSVPENPDATVVSDVWVPIEE